MEKFKSIVFFRKGIYFFFEVCYNINNKSRGDHMKTETWLKENTSSLEGKTVAITGSTGGIGVELCKYIAGLGANLILMDRNSKRSEANKQSLEAAFPSISIACVNVDLEDMESVKTATQAIKEMNVDVFIHNAGAYSIPRHKCSTGYDNVFQINFASPYYIIRELLPNLQKNHGRVVVVGSIAHNYSHIKADDIDFSNVSAASKVYGNAKRYLMFSLYELFKNEQDASLAITHPGITFTNITAHYPKIIFAIIKHPMKVIFIKPKIAALSVLKGLFEATEYHTWIGPRIFDIWGLPIKKSLKTCPQIESEQISKIAETVYETCKSI